MPPEQGVYRNAACPVPAALLAQSWKRNPLQSLALAWRIKAAHMHSIHRTSDCLSPRFSRDRVVPLVVDQRFGLFSLMAKGDAVERRPLSLKEAADRLGMSVNEARACFSHPLAWRTFLALVGRGGGPTTA